MFNIYKRAKVCYAYLRDVSIDNVEDDFVKSEWFKRGWTLQELLAPSDLRFYDRDWKYLGDRKTLSHLVSVASGIDEAVLVGSTDLRACSVAQRMSWAAGRVTTRIEDRAYSLLGIFDVNMTMLYGEGTKAFLRLQEEIIKATDDHSIFAWKGLQPSLPGLLASSPEAFTTSGGIRNVKDRKGRRPFIMNNRGLHGLVPLIPYTLDTYLMLLPCTRQPPAGHVEHVGIFLRRLYEDDQFMRVSVFGQEVMENATSWMRKHWAHGYCMARNISIRQTPLLPGEGASAYVDRIPGIRLNESLLGPCPTSTVSSPVEGEWNPQTRVVSLPLGSRRLHHVGSINIAAQERKIEVIRFGFDYDYNPVVYLTQRGVRYCEEEDRRGVFVESFRAPTEDDTSIRLLDQGENFQNASVALGGRWSRIEMSSNGTLAAYGSDDVDGFWALKADRLDGLDVDLVDADGRVGRVQLLRTMIDGCLIWDLQVDELAPRTVSRRNKRDTGASGRVNDWVLSDIKRITGHINDLSFTGSDS
jgi:hypothetical protein